MACFSAMLGVITALGFVHLTAANKDTCEVSGAVGQNVTVPIDYKGLQSSYTLRWTHNNNIIFYRQQGRLIHGKPEDITGTGSLLLRNIDSRSAGNYKADVLHPNSTLAASWTGRLCIVEKVQKPHLDYVCDFKSNAVNLNCHVAKPQSVKFSWTLDKKVLPSEAKQTLSFSLPLLKDERSFFCSVANSVSEETSNTVRPVCTPPSPAQLCYSPLTVVTVLAGGVALIVLLLITVAALCCRRRDKPHAKVRDNSALTMLALKKQEVDSASPLYETMHRDERFPPASPHPSPRASRQNVSQPEVQTEPAPPPQQQQLSPAVEGREPSPVPKPRTRNIQKLNI